MNEKKWERVKREDVKVGDRVRFFQNGYTVSMRVAEIGITYKDVFRGLKGTGGITVLSGADIYRRRVPKPKLPTERGSVIIATKVSGQGGRWVMVLDSDDNTWTAGVEIGCSAWHEPEYITEWTLAEVKEVA